MRRLTAIHPNPDNPRTIKDSDFHKLVANVLRYPKFLRERPMVTNGEDTILGGNMRYGAISHVLGLTADQFNKLLEKHKVTPEAAEIWREARRRRAIPEEWIAKASDYTPEEVEAFIALDNVNFGTWDWQKMAATWDLKNLPSWGITMPQKFQEPPVHEDGFVPLLEIKTDIKPGDLFQIGRHRLLCGDSRSSDQVARLLDGATLDMVTTDPPYNVDYEGGTGMTIMNDNMEDQQFYQFLLQFHQAWVPHTKDGGAWYVWHADIEGLNFRRAFKDSGLMLKQCLVWVKNALVMGRQDYHWRHEPCLYGWKPGASHYFIDDHTQSTVTEDQLDLKKLSKPQLLELLQKITADDVQTTVMHHDKPLRNDLHPTMKPVLLVAGHVRNSSRPKENVGDGFLGSGTTMVVAEQLDRTCYGMDLDPKYCHNIIERMQQLVTDIKVTRNGKPYELPKQPKNRN